MRMSDTCVCCGREIPEGRQVCLTCESIFGRPYEMPEPTNPLRPYTPYPSKYFIDRRFDPPKPLTADDIYRAMKELGRKK